MENDKKDLRGTRYGKLVLKDVFDKHDGKRKRKFGWFLCDCQKHKERPEFCKIRLDLVTSKDGKRDCGCTTKYNGGRPKSEFPNEDLIGREYGRLKVMYYLEDNKWMCKCNCPLGSEVPVRSDKLKSGLTKSCGCLVKENIGRKMNEDRLEILLNKRFSALKIRMGKKGGDIDFDTFKVIEQQECFFCGGRDDELEKNSGAIFKLVGIDRKNYAEGYTINNIVPCCKKCNFMKNKLTIKQFNNKIKAIYFNNFKSKKYEHSYLIVKDKKTIDRIVSSRAKEYSEHAKKQGFIYELDEGFIKGEILKPCSYCGGYSGISNKDEYYNGLDRVNNDEGYTYDNVVSCCKTCNTSKRTLSKEEFLNNVEKIYKNNR